MCSVKTNVVLSGFPLTMAITYQFDIWICLLKLLQLIIIIQDAGPIINNYYLIVYITNILFN